MRLAKGAGRSPQEVVHLLEAYKHYSKYATQVGLAWAERACLDACNGGALMCVFVCVGPEGCQLAKEPEEHEGGHTHEPPPDAAVTAEHEPSPATAVTQAARRNGRAADADEGARGREDAWGGERVVLHSCMLTPPCTHACVAITCDPFVDVSAACNWRFTPLLLSLGDGDCSMLACVCCCCCVEPGRDRLVGDRSQCRQAGDGSEESEATGITYPC